MRCSTGTTSTSALLHPSRVAYDAGGVSSSQNCLVNHFDGWTLCDESDDRPMVKDGAGVGNVDSITTADEGERVSTGCRLRRLL